MVLGKWPTWCTILVYVFIFIFNSLHLHGPAHDTARDTEWQLPEVVLTQYVSTDDEHDVLKTCRVKNKNKHIEKNCASRWSFTKKHYMMHGQQNIKKYLVWVPYRISIIPPTNCPPNSSIQTTAISGLQALWVDDKDPSLRGHEPRRLVNRYVPNDLHLQRQVIPAGSTAWSDEITMIYRNVGMYICMQSSIP